MVTVDWWLFIALRSYQPGYKEQAENSQTLQLQLNE